MKLLSICGVGILVGWILYDMIGYLSWKFDKAHGDKDWWI